MKIHSSRFLTLIADVKTRTQEITVSQLQEKLQKPEKVHLLDVREDEEWLNTCHIPTAIHMSKGTIERDIEKTIVDSDAPIVVYCSGGYRSVLVAESLQKMGYSNVHSLEKGLQAWLDAGYDIA